MTDFTPINTQEEFDAAISKRIARAERSAEAKFEGWVSPDEVSKRYEGWMNPEESAKLKTEADDLRKALSERDATIKASQIAELKRNVAREIGLGYGFESRISGETEEDIRKDAEALKSLIGNTHKPTPLASRDSEVKGNVSRSDAYRFLLGNINSK